VQCRLRRVFLGNGDTNLRSTAMGTKWESLVNGGLALVAEVVHEAEGTVSSSKFQVLRNAVLDPLAA